MVKKLICFQVLFELQREQKKLVNSWPDWAKAAKAPGESAANPRPARFGRPPRIRWRLRSLTTDDQDIESAGRCRTGLMGWRFVWLQNGQNHLKGPKSCFVPGFLVSYGYSHNWCQLCLVKPLALLGSDIESESSRKTAAHCAINFWTAKRNSHKQINCL